jgi:hypothetical protein
MDLANATISFVVLQTALDAETREHAPLLSAVRAVYDALKTQEGVQSGSSLQSHLTVLYGGVRERARDALHTGIKAGSGGDDFALRQSQPRGCQ